MQKKAISRAHFALRNSSVFAFCLYASSQIKNKSLEWAFVLEIYVDFLYRGGNVTSSRLIRAIENKQ
jgi:hypothetical protein